MTFWDWLAGSPCWAGLYLFVICVTVGYGLLVRANARNNETTGRMFEAGMKKGSGQ